jgi:hypothetical protein
LLLPLLIILLALVLAPSALAADTTPGRIQAAVDAGRISADAGQVYLARAVLAPERLPQHYRGTERWEGTVPLLQVRRQLKGMRRARARDEVSALLQDPCPADLPVQSTTHFHVQYRDPTGVPSLTNYLQTLEAAWNTEVTSFGWPAPPTPAPGNHYPVRIDELDPNLLGYVSREEGTYSGFLGDNPSTGWNEGDAFESCMVLNRNLSSLDELRATVAHELNHSIQYGEGALTGSNAASFFLTEAGATWMEDEVFTDTTDNHGFLYPNFADSLAPHCTGFGDPPGCPPPSVELDLEAYKGWFMLRALTERFGTGVAGGGEDIMQRFWELTSRGQASNLGALDQAFRERGVTLGDAYHDAAIASWFVLPCDPLPRPFCFTDAVAYTDLNGVPNPHDVIAAAPGEKLGQIEDNYATQWIELPRGSRFSVAVASEAGSGALEGTVGCIQGTSVPRQSLEPIAAGQVRVLHDFDATNCDELSVAAIITSTSRTQDNPRTDSLLPYRLTLAAPNSLSALNVGLAGNGSGTVTSAPAGISCRTVCGHVFARGSQVTLTAAPAAGSTFSGWGGACGGTGDCTVTLDSAKDVVATFTVDPTVTPTPTPTPTPQPPQPTATPTPPRDTTAPRLGVKVGKRSRGGRIKITVTCPRSEQSRCTGSLTVTARAGKRKVKLGTKRIPSLAPGRSATITFRISASKRKRLRARRITLSVDARAGDTAGNRRRQRATLRTRL